MLLEMEQGQEGFFIMCMESTLFTREFIDFQILSLILTFSIII